MPKRALEESKGDECRREKNQKISDIEDVQASSDVDEDIFITVQKVLDACLGFCKRCGDLEIVCDIKPKDISSDHSLSESSLQIFQLLGFVRINRKREAVEWLGKEATPNALQTQADIGISEEDPRSVVSVLRIIIRSIMSFRDGTWTLNDLVNKLSSSKKSMVSSKAIDGSSSGEETDSEVPQLTLKAKKEALKGICSSMLRLLVKLNLLNFMKNEETYKLKTEILKKDSDCSWSTGSESTQVVNDQDDNAMNEPQKLFSSPFLIAENAFSLEGGEHDECRKTMHHLMDTNIKLEPMLPLPATMLKYQTRCLREFMILYKNYFEKHCSAKQKDIYHRQNKKIQLDDGLEVFRKLSKGFKYDPEVGSARDSLKYHIAQFPQKLEQFATSVSSNSLSGMNSQETIYQEQDPEIVLTTDALKLLAKASLGRG